MFHEYKTYVKKKNVKFKKKKLYIILLLHFYK